MVEWFLRKGIAVVRLRNWLRMTWWARRSFARVVLDGGMIPEEGHCDVHLRNRLRMTRW